MEAQKRTRSEVLAASLAQAKADLEVARKARDHFNARADELRALAAEQTSPSAHYRYTNAQVQQRGQALGMQREVSQLTVLIEELERELAEGDCVALTADQVAGMDETLEALL